MIDSKALYSAVIDVFFSLAANFCTMSIRKTLHYICFVSFINNGTSGIAEIHRIIMNDLSFYKEVLESTYDGNLYKFLIEEFGPRKHREYGHDIWHDMQVGSNRPNRYVPSNCTKTKWDDLTEDIFNLLLPFYQDKNKKTTQTQIKATLGSLVYSLIHEKNTDRPGKKYNGAGALSVQVFIHFASYFGLIPMCCATFGHVADGKLGPAEFIRLACNDPNMKVEECNKVLHSVHSDFSDQWGVMVTLGLLENIYCELKRAYKATCASLRKSKIYTKGADIPLEVLMNPHMYQESKKDDMFFINEATGCVQNFYCLSFSSGKSSKLRPSLKIRHSKNTNDPDKRLQDCKFTLTNWDGKDDNIVDWSERPSNWNIDSTYLQFKPAHKYLFPSK